MRKLEARNERLQEALRAAGREIDSLTYAIAHDLRAPLMHIDGFAQLLQSSPGAVLDHESREHLERIIGATRTLNEQLGALVDYSRVNSSELVMTEVDLEDVLSESLQRARLLHCDQMQGYFVQVMRCSARRWCAIKVNLQGKHRLTHED